MPLIQRLAGVIAAAVQLSTGRAESQAPPQQSGPSAGNHASVLGELPASYSGDLPCADCAGIRYSLNLFSDRSFFLSVIYLGKDDRGQGT